MFQTNKNNSKVIQMLRFWLFFFVLWQFLSFTTVKQVIGITAACAIKQHLSKPPTQQTDAFFFFFFLNKYYNKQKKKQKKIFLNKIITFTIVLYDEQQFCI